LTLYVSHFAVFSHARTHFSIRSCMTSHTQPCRCSSNGAAMKKDEVKKSFPSTWEKFLFDENSYTFLTGTSQEAISNLKKCRWHNEMQPRFRKEYVSDLGQKVIDTHDVIIMRDYWPCENSKERKAWNKLINSACTGKGHHRVMPSYNVPALCDQHGFRVISRSTVVLDSPGGTILAVFTIGQPPRLMQVI
jgi:hypothetical protein